jgi:hypothetical protein
MAVTAPAEQWETWTGLALPAPGSYVVPEGLVPVKVDGLGIGTYVEPNVWMAHHL